MKIKLFTVFVLFLSFAIFAGAPEQESPFSLTISTLKTDYILAEPVCVTVTLRNISKEPIKFERPVLDIPLNFRISAISDEGITGGIGAEGTYLNGYSEIKDMQNDGSCILLPNGVFQVTRCNLLNILHAPSTWEIWAEFSGRGSFIPVIIVMPGAPPQKQLCEGCWKGKVESNKVTIHFTQPTGLELEAYERNIKPWYFPEWKGGSHEWFRDEVFAKGYPDTLYATWARFVQVESAISLYCGPFMREPNGLKYLPMRRASYSPQHRDEVAKPEKSRAPYLIEQCRGILRNHPNLEPVASVTRVNLAALLYITGDTPSAKEQLETVVKNHPDWDEGKMAKQMLEVISEPLPQQAPAPPVAPPPPAPKGCYES